MGVEFGDSRTQCGQQEIQDNEKIIHAESVRGC
jgi:hypothetical protein